VQFFGVIERMKGGRVLAVPSAQRGHGQFSLKSLDRKGVARTDNRSVTEVALFLRTRRHDMPSVAAGAGLLSPLVLGPRSAGLIPASPRAFPACPGQYARVATQGKTRALTLVATTSPDAARRSSVERVPAFEPAVPALSVLGDFSFAAPGAVLVEFREGVRVHRVAAMIPPMMMLVIKKAMTSCTRNSWLKKSRLNALL
jgi:hypothetical protein